MSVRREVASILSSDSTLLTDASAIASAVKKGSITALQMTQQTLQIVADLNPRYNCFTHVTEQRALQEATAIDQARSAGKVLPPLAGVPYAVKNLFDIAGLTTLAGAKINATQPPAQQDAELVRTMRQAGAILLGALNMDEYAYGFTTENYHYGVTRNPHDPTRSAGGSSGGCAAAVAAGMVPLSLGSDTNGSIRVPSSLCGIFGLKPTYGKLSLQGMFPFVHSFDHAGVFARSMQDLALSYQVLTGNHDTNAMDVSADSGITDIRIALAADYFEQGDVHATAAVQALATALGVTKKISLPEVVRARSAAYLITASEGANLHWQRLRTQAQEFDPLTRPRLLAGSLLPAAWYVQAQRFRAWFYEQVMQLFRQVDILIAPATPCSAQLLGQDSMILNGVSMPLRPNMGLFTQPISFIGLPVVTVPVQQQGGMPIGVQIIAAPHCEDKAMRVAAWLEAQAVCSAPVVNH